MKTIIFFAIIFLSVFIIEEAWAQSSSFAEGLFDDPGSFLGPEGEALVFLLFLIGIAIYAIFVWYFYRFISKRDLLPKKLYPASHDEKVSKIKLLGYVGVYTVTFPFIIFVWFVVLSFFVFLIAKEMPFDIAIFVSMAVIGVVRILSYYKEDAAKEVAKMIPYAILSFLLTSIAVYSNPNFFTQKAMGSIPNLFLENLEGIVGAILIITVFEFAFRIGFIIKRKFLPAPEKKLEEEIGTEVQEITKAHFKKMEDKEKELETKIENKVFEFKKMEEKEKELEKKLEEKQKKLVEELEKQKSAEK